MAESTIRVLEADEAAAAVPALADVLIDCVHGGASVSFMAPLPLARAVAFWLPEVSLPVTAGQGDKCAV